MKKTLFFIKGIKWLILLGIFLGGFLCLLAFFLNHYGQNFIKFALEKALSNQNQTVMIENLSPIFASHISAKNIQISDENGVWLKLNDISLNWSPLALLNRKIHIKNLQIQQIHFIRKPLKNIDLDVAKNKKITFPFFLKNIQLDQFNTKKFFFFQKNKKNSKIFYAKGMLNFGKNKFQAHLQAQDLQKNENLHFNVNYQENINYLAFNLHFNEKKGGILNNLLDIPNQPNLDLLITSNNKLNDFKLKINVTADRKTVLKGQATLKNFKEAKNFTLNLEGEISDILSKKYSSFFEGENILSLNGNISKKKKIDIKNITFQNKNFQADAKAIILPSGFLRKFSLHASTKNKNQKFSPLPFFGKNLTSAKNMQMNIDYGQENSKNWQGHFLIENLKNADFNIKKINLKMGGAAQNLDDPKKRHLGINIHGKISGLTEYQSDNLKPLDHDVQLEAFAYFNGQSPLNIQKLSLSTDKNNLNIQGRIKNQNFIGKIELNSQNLSKIGKIFHQSIAGKLSLKAEGIIPIKKRGFSLYLSGNTQNLEMNSFNTKNTIKEPLKISGKIMHNNQGWVTKNLNIFNSNMSLSSDGMISSHRAFMDFKIKIKNLALINSNLQGPLNFKVSARGRNNFIHFTSVGKIPNGFIRGKAIKNLYFTNNLILNNSLNEKKSFRFFSEGKGIYDGKPLILSFDLINQTSKTSLKKLVLHTKNTNILAHFSKNSNNFYNGKLSVQSQNIEDLLNPFFIKGAGAINLDLSFNEKNGVQNANIKTNIKNLSVQNYFVKSLDTDLQLEKTPQRIQIFGNANLNDFHTSFNAKQKSYNPIFIHNLNFSSKKVNGNMEVSLKTNLMNNVNVNLQAILNNINKDKNNLYLKKLHIFDKINNLNLVDTSRISILKDSISLNHLKLRDNQGFINLNGSISHKMDLNSQFDKFSLSLLNSFFPNLGLSGQLSGNFHAKGSLNDPNLQFDLLGENLKSNFLKKNNISPFRGSASGRIDRRAVILKANIKGHNITMNADGQIKIKSNEIAAHVKIGNFPAEIFKKTLQLYDLQGQIQGDISASGTLQNPNIIYNFKSDNLTIQSLQVSKIKTISANLNGNLTDKNIYIQDLFLSEQKKLNYHISGRIDLKNQSLNLKTYGFLPIEIFNPYIINHGNHISGLLKLDTNIQGSLNNPSVFGNFSIKDASLFEAFTNINLKNIKAEGNIQNKTINFIDIQAESRSGGTAKGNGYILFDFEKGLPSEFNVHLQEYKYNYGAIVITTINAPLHIYGPLLNNPTIEGTVNLPKTEIIIPRNIHKSQELKIEHLYLTEPILRTLKRASVNKKKYDSQPQNQNILQLKLHVNAPARVFIRGNGLDAELGGSVFFTGPANQLQPVGNLQLIRGRYDIGSQKMNFDSGQLNFTGNIDPTISLTGKAESDDIVVKAEVSGTIANLKMSLTSEPPLPQDEILAHFLFNTSLNQLSPIQIAHLAITISEMSGAHDSLINNLRSHIGMDDIDLLTDNKGYVALKLGKYLKNNFYVGIEAGNTGQTKLDLNYNFTKALKAKGSFSTNGQSNIGLFFEKDY